MKALNVEAPGLDCVEVVKKAQDYSTSPGSLILSDKVSVDMLERLIIDCEALVELCVCSMTLVELDYEIYTTDEHCDWVVGSSGIIFYPGNHISGCDMVVYQQQRNKHDDTDYIETEGISIFKLMAYLRKISKWGELND